MQIRAAAGLPVFRIKPNADGAYCRPVNRPLCHTFQKSGKIYFLNQSILSLRFLKKSSSPSKSNFASLDFIIPDTIAATVKRNTATMILYFVGIRVNIFTVCNFYLCLYNLYFYVSIFYIIAFLPPFV